MSALAAARHAAAGPVPRRRFGAVPARIRPFVLPLALLLSWEIVAHRGWVNPVFMPSPEAVVGRGMREFGQGGFFGNLLASLQRDLAGFALGSLAGTGAGLAIGFSAKLQRLLGPSLLAQRQIALFAWVPLVSLWCGGGEGGKLAFVALAAFQPTLVGTWQGVAGIPRAYRELAAVLTYGPLDYARFIAIPGALPTIFTGLHTALIYAWTATIGAELLLNVAPGLGGRMNEGQQLFQMDLLLLCLFVLGSVGACFNLSATALERRFLRWRLA